MKKLLLPSAVILLLLAGCSKEASSPDAKSKSLKATNYYQAWTAGSGNMNAQNLGNGHYTVSWSNVGDIVVGAGYNPCNNATMSWTGSASNAQYFGVYGWLSSPLTEYYIGRGGGQSAGTYSTSKGTYTLNTVACNGANINGNGPFTQFNCSGSGSSPINMGEHFQGWKNLGKQVNTQNYCIVAVEAWNSSGSADVTVGGSSGGGTGGGTGQITLNSWQCNNHSSGLNIWNGGVGSWTNGAWIEFNSVNLSGKTGINLNLATTQSGQFAIKIDSNNGTQIGTLGYGSTGSWSTYQNKSTSISGSGTHNLYIVCTGGAANVGTISIY
ncbi:MAG TPA: glycoside hydrolase family 11 protein [Bacteroidales bacterium]